MTAPSKREPRKPHCILKQFGGCGSKSGAETGICAFGGAPRCPGLFSLRQADMSTSNPRANRLLPQTPPPSNPCHIRVTENGADQSRLRFPWRRDRDLNPGRHHCLTRFRIVRVQPLRHLCKGGGHTDAEAVRPEYIQTDASSILQEIGKKSNRFCALAGDFLLEYIMTC